MRQKRNDGFNKSNTKSELRNVVELLDEMAIGQLKRYSLIEMTDDEKKFLQKNKFIN
jgi:hypothetical protein